MKEIESGSLMLPKAKIGSQLQMYTCCDWLISSYVHSKRRLAIIEAAIRGTLTSSPHIMSEMFGRLSKRPHHMLKAPSPRSCAEMRSVVIRAHEMSQQQQPLYLF